MSNIQEEEIKSILPTEGPSFEEVKNYLKKWDKIIKELRGNDLISIIKSEDGNLFIKPV